MEGTATAVPAYVWAAQWLEPADAALEMSHSGIAVLRDGLIVTGATGGRATLAFHRRDGEPVRRTVVSDADDVHDLTLVEDGGEELLWIADTATRLFGGQPALQITRRAERGQVLLADLDGNVRRRLDTPPVAEYESVGYRPTAVVVDEPRFGGSGEIWVSDGYGAGLVHRYAADGTYQQTLTGEAGAGRFREPHDLLIDRRGDRPELYVSDRLNARLQVFDLEGRFLRTVGDGALPGPTQMATDGELLAVTDLLSGRVALFDREDRFLAYLFAHPAPPAGWDATPDGWPNARSGDGLLEPVSLEPGVFHTPHGVAFDPDGTMYVSEFSIGGRIAVLRPDRA